MINNISGINEEGIDKLIHDIYNCADNINKSINNISNDIDQTSYIFQMSLADEMRSKYDYNRLRIQNIYEQIERYNSYLLEIKSKYQDLDFNIVNEIKKSDIKEEYNE